MTAPEARSIAHDLVFAPDLPLPVWLWLDGIRRLDDSAVVDARTAAQLRGMYTHFRGAVVWHEEQEEVTGV